jgi:hypothetical protein
MPTQLAEAILALINSKPRTPTAQEIEQVVEATISKAAIAHDLLKVDASLIAEATAKAEKELAELKASGPIPAIPDWWAPHISLLWDETTDNLIIESSPRRGEVGTWCFCITGAGLKRDPFDAMKKMCEGIDLCRLATWKVMHCPHPAWQPLQRGVHQIDFKFVECKQCGFQREAD